MRLEIRCQDRIGMAQEILDLLIPHGIDLRKIEVGALSDSLYVGFDDIDFKRLQSLLSGIRRLAGVMDVKTVNYTPSEREQFALFTLMEALPDGVVAIDLEGKVTLATARAASDIGVPAKQLIGSSLNTFIRSIAFDKLDWQSLPKGVTKRVRLNGQLVLLEIQPFYIENETDQQVCAGSVVHIRSAQRLGRQTSSLRKAPNSEAAGLNSVFSANETKSAGMIRAKKVSMAYLNSETPMLVSGEMAVGKKHLVGALFDEWRTRNLEDQAKLLFVLGKDLTALTLIEALESSTWLVIEHIEELSGECQLCLMQWLSDQPSRLYQETAPTRLIALSRKKSAELAQTSSFLPELHHALSVFQLDIPPLRARKEDLSAVVERMLIRISERHEKHVCAISREALALIKIHHWPGNFKELESCILQAVNVANENRIEAEDLPIEVNNTVSVELIDQSLDKTLKSYEAELLRKLYPQYPSTRKLAQFLKVSHSSIANKLKEYNIV
ncbi:transcriptional regulator [Marinomonas piezotolerans]|uniref:Transcriptional regulator n=1 Tax=Marinomonas piezotolerans TaxID=2213058 RepID=A0A370U5U1_9GAMM|nr:TyrR/PhhR family helix-turn-helix DNA-binding protein [Marinomonas piezotolerans]RDL43139.1 transcriptional regulator [Marinomonas piezotolerans]